MISNLLKLQIIALISIWTVNGFMFSPRRISWGLKSKDSTRLYADAEVNTATSSKSGDKRNKEDSLTQKDYFIAIRNRLFAVDEQLWLHDYALANPDSKIPFLTEDKLEKLMEHRGDLRTNFPSTLLQLDLAFAYKNNMTYAAQYIERLLDDFHRKLPLTLDHVNQIAVLSSSGEVVNLMRGQGAASHRLRSSNLLTGSNDGEAQLKRQFQHPAFSSSGKFIAVVEMIFRDSKVVRSNILVHEVPKDPKTYSKGTGSMPIFDSRKLPGTPFFLTFSPDDQTIALLCTSKNDPSTQLILIDWNKYYSREYETVNGELNRNVKKGLYTVLKGSPLFFSYTKSNPLNATIVAHCQKEYEDPFTNETIKEKAVWLLSKRDTEGVSDYVWKKVCDSDMSSRWTTPIAHCAGGGDNVLVVEDGYLTTKAISRWKRDANGELYSKKLLKVEGQIQFLVAPDNSRVVVLQEDINIGLYSLKVIEGEDALDPKHPSLGQQYEVPNDRLAVAFWFSPDSTKLLCLTAAGKSKKDVMTQRSQFRVGLNSEMEWTVLNFPLREARTYDKFKPTPYFMKTYVPFFGQYAQMFNPWAPDSKSFIYISNNGLIHVPLVENRVILGRDRWQNVGSTFATWSRF